MLGYSRCLVRVGKRRRPAQGQFIVLNNIFGRYRKRKRTDIGLDLGLHDGRD